MKLFISSPQVLDMFDKVPETKELYDYDEEDKCVWLQIQDFIQMQQHAKCTLLIVRRGTEYHIMNAG